MDTANFELPDLQNIQDREAETLDLEFCFVAESTTQSQVFCLRFQPLVATHFSRCGSTPYIGPDELPSSSAVRTREDATKARSRLNGTSLSSPRACHAAI